MQQRSHPCPPDCICRFAERRLETVVLTIGHMIDGSIEIEALPHVRDAAVVALEALRRAHGLTLPRAGAGVR